MIDLFLKLIDKLIDMGKRREEMNKQSFTEFVTPAMEDLEVVHKDYLDSFARYQDMLKDKNIPLTLEHPIFSAIENDNLFSEGLRAKILELDPFMDDPVFGHFMVTVKWYVSGATTPPEVIAYEEWDGRSQARRVKYRNNLKEVIGSNKSESEKRIEAVEAIHESIESLQRYYHSIVREYSELKKKLLSPL